jgi:hypothetical protein
MTKLAHPWQTGPTELIEFALNRIHQGNDFDRRLAFLVLDVGVETLIKTFLTLPDSVTGVKTSFTARNNAAQGGFHQLIQGLQDAIPERAAKFDLTHVQYYHGIRNTLYHQGDTVAAVRDDQLRGYALLAVTLLRELLNIDLSELLVSLEVEIKTSDDPVVDSVEVEISFGRYRIERLKSHSIRILSLDTSTFETPVRPFLRAVIEELTLPIEFTFKSGKEKNTQSLGKDVIDELKPSAWHGWVAGQKIRKDTLVVELIKRIREGNADQKNWEIVDFIQGLKFETLIFQPIGKGFGNSPFNLNCWHTERGEPIKPK